MKALLSLKRHSQQVSLKRRSHQGGEALGQLGAALQLEEVGDVDARCSKAGVDGAGASHDHGLSLWVDEGWERRVGWSVGWVAQRAGGVG